MNKNLQSPTKLTEFAPLQSEEKQQSVGQFISKLFKLNKTSPTTDNASINTEKPLDNTSQESLPTWAIESTQENCEARNDYYYQVDVNEGRSLPNVLKRISNLLALKSTNLQAYSDTELKQYWMPDSVSKECYECGEKFTTFRRRHHCRVCGQIFCSQCCSQQIPGKIFGCTGDLRVCTYCCKVVLSYLQSPDVGADLTADLKALQENLLNKYGANSPVGNSVLGIGAILNPISNSSLETGGTLRRKISLGYQEEKFAIGRPPSESYMSPEEKCKVLQNSASLRSLYEEICRPASGVPLQIHRYRLRTYSDCFLGSELVDWLIYQQKANSRVQAVAICQALLEGAYIDCVSEPSCFTDGYALYKLGILPNEPPVDMHTCDLPNQDEPIWTRQVPQELSSTTDSESDNAVQTPSNSTHFKSSSSYMLDLNLESNTVYLSKPPPSVQNIYSPVDCDTSLKKDIICEEPPAVNTSEQREFVPESGWHKPSHLREENGEKFVYNVITNTYKQHEEGLLKQLLSIHGLSVSWVDTIIKLTHEIVDLIRPDKNHDAEDIDVLRYVQFKKVSGGARTDSQLVGGIVCSKNIAHKYMSTKLENPKILILQCSLVYQRTEGRLMSLEPILMQEHEYLRNVVARIIALQPDVILVQRNVSRLAQDLLLAQGMTLVLNVKQTVLERLARCTQADLVTSMDAHIGRPRLGTCKSFYLKTFDIERGGCKTLMFFEGLPLSHLGATVLLRGASFKELESIKQISRLLLFASYNWRLEKSFLMDEFAQPPNSKEEFFDDSKENSPDLPISKIPISDSDNKSKLELFSDSENDAEFFSMNTRSDSYTATSNNTTKSERAERVSEDRKVTPESTSDFSDPLLSCNLEDDVFKSNNIEKFSVAELPFSNTFRKALDDTILCISPYIVFTIPYLETDSGRKCKLRNFFPPELYLSQQIEKKKKVKSKDVAANEGCNLQSHNLHLKPSHPFITERIRRSADSSEFQSMLAHFRACGGRLEHKDAVVRDDDKENRHNETKHVPEYESNHLDALDLLSHQKLGVLFCSFSHLSNNAPAFCVKMVVAMEFYGVNDIPLGCFLERYCFRSTYKCASNTCDSPMLKHIRRFVHNGGCLSLFLNSFENEFEESGIVMWSWCSKCHKVSPVVPMSNDTWSFSFAKYLELRFYGGLYTRRGSAGCSHSLHHDHFQYFGYKNLVASFKYTPVQLWEISLPPTLITILYNVVEQQSKLIDEIKTLALKGHEIYNLINDRLLIFSTDIEGCSALKQILAKEQLNFKQKIEEVQLKLTSPTLESKDLIFDGEDEDNRKQIAVWRIEDVIIRIKRLILECVEQWNVRLADLAKKRESDKKREKVVSVDLDSPEAVEAQPLVVSQPVEAKVDHPTSSGLSTKKIKSLDQGDDESVSSSPKIHHRSQSDGTAMSQMILYDDFQDNKKEIDKKTVKNILSQLLPSSINVTPIQLPFGIQEHYTLPTGVSIPIVVYENEPSSIVAYALNSFDYKRSLDEMMGKKPQSAEQSPSPVHKRKSQSDKDQSEGGDSSSSRILSFLRSKDSKNDLLHSVQVGAGIESSQTEESPPSLEKQDDARKGKPLHIEIQFSDHNTNFFCRIYYAERFAWLRSIFVPDGEEAFTRSLSRCVQWNAQGGKSGSTFCKTMDDRFVLKELPKSEIQLFLDSAHNYFDYLQRCFDSRQPTLLGKIVGIYQIIYRNVTTNATLRTNLLVMENLFYNRKVTHKFDLKGSMRNRLVNPDNQEGEIVLLDENLLKMSCETPLYILPHSKVVLTAAIHNDTEFLSEQSVMDYSLLVGLDSDNKELVLGIIDYIRTFTWDKKLETMVKKSGLLGGQGKLPTIISPKEYRKRFIDAMHRYFLMVPDHWAGLGRGLEC
uniref:1-phosphatidylinositol-3-phosphate 5-kinase n=1 Tax=Photinus pyralis TaxID=7054 RepID=A0A1Y1N0Y2_PHOPY